jgi:hypothetical protein
MKGQIMNHGTLRIWKRKAAWLALIPVLAILCLGAVPQSQSNQANVHSMCKWAFIEGSWLSLVVFPDGTSFQSPMSFCAGGAMIVSDPMGFPWLPMRTAYHGTWARKGPRTFVFTMVGFVYCYADPNDPENYPVEGLYKLVIKETDTILRDGDTYEGDGHVWWYAPDGTLLADYPTPTHAERIHAE